MYVVNFKNWLTKPLNLKRYSGYLFLLLSFLWIGFNLRAPITAVAPILHQIQQGLGMGSSMVALLTSIPILCFGLMTPFASLVIRRLEIDKAIFLSLSGVAVGSLLRVCGQIPLMLFGTFVIGISLTIGNIVCLMIIARDFYSRMHLVTGLYVVAMSMGSMTTSAVTAPLAQLGGWRFGLGAWSFLPLLGMMLWAAVVVRRVPAAPEQTRANASMLLNDSPTAPISLLKNRLVWMLTLAFAAHLILFYSLTAWLPTYYMQSQGMSETAAGYIESVFQVTAFIGAFGVPILTSLSWTTNFMIMVSVGVVWFLITIGFLWFPEFWFVIALISGFAQGGGFSIIFSILMSSAKSLDENRRMSSFVQGGGYAVSAFGPLLIGFIHEQVGSWTVAMIVLSCFSMIIIGAALGVKRVAGYTPPENSQ